MMDGSAISPPLSSRLDVWDYVTMSCVVLLSSSVGIYHVFAARSVKNARQFVVISRDIGVLPLILSAIASFVSAITFIGFPVETYTNGAIFATFALTGIFLSPIFGTFLYLPIFFNSGITTLYEYLELRFNRFIRLVSSIVMTFSMILYTACVIYAPALAINQVTGLHVWSSVISIGIICILYTSLGGIKAVVWADVVQILVMVVVLLIIIVRGIMHAGGVSEVWRIVTEGQRGDLLLFSPSKNSKYTSWTLTFGASIKMMGPIIINQLMLQRYLSNETLTKTRISFIGSITGNAIMVFLTSYAGLLIYARYHDCDPLLSGLVTSRDQLMALFGIEMLSFCKGLPGIFVGSILCATLSTLSSALNTLTAVTMEDYVRPAFPDISDVTAMRLSKFLGVFFGAVCMVLVAVAESMGGVVHAVFSINGLTTGPVLSLFTIGMLLPWVTSLAAFCGFIASIAFTSWICIGALITKPVQPSAPYSCDGCTFEATNAFYGNGSVTMSHIQFLNGSQTCDANLISPTEDTGFVLYSMSALWYTTWSLCICTIVSLLASLIFGTQNVTDVDPKLICPLTKYICRKFPVAVQNKLGYGPTKNSTMAELETHYSELPLKIALPDDDAVTSLPAAVGFMNPTC